MKSTEVTSSADVIVSYDWAPKYGGAHHWLKEVYSRRTTPVQVFTSTRMSGNECPPVSHNRSDFIVHRTLASIERIALNPSTGIAFYGNAISISRQATGCRLIHCKAAIPDAITGLAAARLCASRPRVVVYAHGEEVLIARSSRLLTVLTRAAYNMADLVIANSKSTESLVRSIANPARVAVVHPGVDVATFGNVRRSDDLRATWGASPRTCVFLCIGRLEPRKNTVRVLRAVAKLRTEGLDVAFICVGDGEDRPRLEREVVALGASRWAKLLGTVDEADKLKILGSADVFSMPSIRHGETIEGFGIVFLEASACGLACIAGTNGGQPEAVLDEKTGLVVDGTDDIALLDALRRLATDNKLRLRLGNAGREWASRHDWAHVVERTESALRDAGF